LFSEKTKQLEMNFNYEEKKEKTNYVEDKCDNKYPLKNNFTF
jgi:hypothetical protein